jgi:hypothetical protein
MLFDYAFDIIFWKQCLIQLTNKDKAAFSSPTNSLVDALRCDNAGRFCCHENQASAG